MCDHKGWCANWRRRLGGARAGEKYFARTSMVRRGGDVLRLGVNGARAGGLKCAAPEVDFGNRIGYSCTM